MIISGKDKEESLKVSQLIKKIDLIDKEYVNQETDTISQKQPFLISLILGYSHDLKGHELEEIIKIILLIWEFFKDFKPVNESKISESQFERIHQRNIHMFKYYEGEQGENAKLEFVDSELKHLNSKSLFVGVFFQFNHKKALLEMRMEKRGILLTGLKSLIECFEEIVNNK